VRPAAGRLRRAARASARLKRRDAAVDELEACQVDDDSRLPGRDHRKRSRNVRGICDVWLCAQRDSNMTAAFANTKIYAERRRTFLLKQQGGVLAQRLIHRLLSSMVRRIPANVLVRATRSLQRGQGDAHVVVPSATGTCHVAESATARVAGLSF
jgi:hypothetical protein